MSGHGHVVPNADGTRARCGGPSLCKECAQEAMQLGVAYSLQPAIDLAREKLAQDAKPHNCMWCPVEVRDLAAVAHNAVVNYGSSRERQKMADLKATIERYQPAMDAHFAALKDEDPAKLRAEIERLTQDRDSWKRRAAKHGCDVERGDPDCG